jgi:hypothetical protein
MNNWITWTTFGLIMSIAAACNDDSSERCVNSGDCPLPQVCVPLETDESGAIVRGFCGIDCRVDTDCLADNFCIESVCQPADRPCRTQEDCEPFGRTCVAGILRCVQRCTPSLPCPSGSYCEGGYCLPEGVDATLVSVNPSDAQGMPPSREDMAIPRMDFGSLIPPQTDMRIVDRNVPAPQPDATIIDMRVVLPVDMMVAPTGAEYGEACQRAADCQSSVCLPNVYQRGTTSVGICSSNCTRSSDCPGLDSCASIQDASSLTTQVCVPNETGQDCTENTSGAQCPYHRVCNRPPNPFPQEVPVASQCASECNVSSDCPAGYTCNLVAVGNMNQLICTPDIDIRLCQGSNAQCGGVCPNTNGANEADVAHCVGFGGAAVLCTCECNSASDCPRGFACDATSELPFVLSSGRAGMCFPIAGYRCDGSESACMSAACTRTSTELDRLVCTSPCRNANDCPSGYVCDVDPQLGVRVCSPEN